MVCRFFCCKLVVRTPRGSRAKNGPPPTVVQGCQGFSGATPCKGSLPPFFPAAESAAEPEDGVEAGERDIVFIAERMCHGVTVAPQTRLMVQVEIRQFGRTPVQALALVDTGAEVKLVRKGCCVNGFENLSISRKGS